MQARGHSAHVGQEVEVFYRWHPLYGRRVRRQYSEQRASGPVVHVEVSAGIVIVMAAWMLDAASCAGMELGAPRASVSALAELHHLLWQHGLRRSSSGVFHTREEQDDQFTQTAPDAACIVRADAAPSTEHGVRLPCTPGNGPERTSHCGHAVGDPAAASSGRATTRSC
ncbi:conserved hypothetical protein [Thiomonas sp. X19]|nr:conserved hypothetical protein [Thiomonas sp. X19]